MINKKGQRADAMFVVLLVTLILSIYIPMTIGAFRDLTDPDPNSAVYGVSKFFSQGIEMCLPVPIFDDPCINFDFFGLLPDSIENYFDRAWNVYTYLPDYLSLPILVVVCSCFVYVIVTLIPTVGG